MDKNPTGLEIQDLPAEADLRAYLRWSRRYVLSSLISAVISGGIMYQLFAITNEPVGRIMMIALGFCLFWVVKWVVYRILFTWERRHHGDR